MATDPLFGWDLTFKSVEKDVTRKADVIVVFIHFNLIKRGFRSIGIGDERTLSGDEETSELLPTGWNDKDNYTLRYVLEDKLYILHGLNTDGNLIINLMRSEDLAVSNLAMKIDDTVKDLKGNIDKIMPNHKDLMFNIKRDLIETITTRHTNTAETQTSGETSRRPPADDPLRVLPRPSPRVQPDVPNLWYYNSALQLGLCPLIYQQLVRIQVMARNPPPGLGRADLDPFAPGGGGMIFNPFGPRRDVENPGLGVPGGLPRGAIPPGARFDPFGPPGVGPLNGRGNRRAPPDADHLPPPGFNDNMFM